MHERDIEAREARHAALPVVSGEGRPARKLPVVE